MDSRALLSASGSNNTPNPPNNTMVDTLDFTQIYASWADQNAFLSGLGVEIKAGRQTMDLGSRRLVARPIYRNTVNNFTGMRIRVLDYGQWQLNAFGTMPVLRFPNYIKTPANGDPNLLAANANLLSNGDQQWDQEDTHTWFSGGILEGYDVVKNVNVDLALYALNESDSNNNPTRNRNYFTSNLAKGILTLSPRAWGSSVPCNTIPPSTINNYITRRFPTISKRAIALTCPCPPVFLWNMTGPAAVTTAASIGLVPPTVVSIRFMALQIWILAQPASMVLFNAATSIRRAPGSILHPVKMLRFPCKNGLSGWHRPAIAGEDHPAHQRHRPV
jgi:hypothetical protein